MSDQCLRDYLDTVVRLAKDAGNMMLSTSGKNSQIDEKANFRDLVTETDKAIEDYVFSSLKKKYPDCVCIGEETYQGNVQLDDRVTFIVDPIDGTTNYIHQTQFCCISVGMLIKKELVLGVVYSPFLNKLYTATKNGGAFLNGQPIHTKKSTKTLDKALLIIEYGSADDETKKNAVFSNLKNFLWKCHGIRQFGSAALNLCHVAEGACDSYFEFGCHVWDFAGGAMIVKEAGGEVLDPTGKPWDLLARRILVTGTPELAKQIIDSGLVVLDFPSD